MRYLLPLFLIGCGARPSIPSHDPTFDPYVNTYAEYKLEYTGQLYKPISISFGQMHDINRIGECSMAKGSSKVKYIVINEEFWYDEFTSDIDRLVLVFHELGHCDLYRDHTDSKSIMELVHISYSFIGNEEYYLNELFFPNTHMLGEIDMMRK